MGAQNPGFHTTCSVHRLANLYGRQENVAIKNDVLPLKAARRDAIANLNYGAPGLQRPNFDGFIYIHYTTHGYRQRLSPKLLPFVEV